MSRAQIANYYVYSLSRMLSDDTIKECLADYGAQPDQPQCEKIRVYIALLQRWNQSISLTSVTDEAKILRFHFGESVFALAAAHPINGRLADVGTGAGFPGLPLKILNDRIELLLIESNSKKCAFLNEAARQLGLTGTRVLRANYEEALESSSEKLDVIASRALGGYTDLLHWAAGVLEPSGRTILWIGEQDAERLRSTPGWLWHSKTAIPGSQRRHLLIGTRAHRAQ